MEGMESQITLKCLGVQLRLVRWLCDNCPGAFLYITSKTYM